MMPSLGKTVAKLVPMLKQPAPAWCQLVPSWLHRSVTSWSERLRTVSNHMGKVVGKLAARAINPATPTDVVWLNGNN